MLAPIVQLVASDEMKGLAYNKYQWAQAVLHVETAEEDKAHVARKLEGLKAAVNNPAHYIFEIQHPLPITAEQFTVMYLAPKNTRFESYMRNHLLEGRTKELFNQAVKYGIMTKEEAACPKPRLPVSLCEKLILPYISETHNLVVSLFDGMCGFFIFSWSIRYVLQ